MKLLRIHESRIKKLVPVLRKSWWISPLTARKQRLVGGVGEVLVLDLRKLDLSKRWWISPTARKQRLVSGVGEVLVLVLRGRSWISLDACVCKIK